MLCLLEWRLLAAQHRKIAKAKRRAFFNCLEQLLKNFLVWYAAVFDLKMVAILLANTKKSLKFHYFESVQNLSSAICKRVFTSWNQVGHLYFLSSFQYQFRNCQFFSLLNTSLVIMFVLSPSPLIWFTFMGKHQLNVFYQASTPSK